MDCVSEGSIKKCLGALKMLATDANEPSNGTDQVECFLTESVESCRGSDVTSEELYEHYRSWSGTSNVIPLAMRQFCVNLPLCMAKLYGVGKSHCIERDGSGTSGILSGVRIKRTAIGEDASDG